MQTSSHLMWLYNEVCVWTWLKTLKAGLHILVIKKEKSGDDVIMTKTVNFDFSIKSYVNKIY